ncbi:MAG: cytochrome P450 [Cyanobacteria bacterium J06632_3]
MSVSPSNKTSIKPPLPPGNFGLPIIGETLKFFNDSDFAKKRHAEFGPVFKTRLLGSPTVFVKGPEGNRFILSHENDYFQVSWPPSVKKLLGPLSLALQSGHTHTARRKLLVQAFQPRALSGYIPAMEAISDRYFQSWLDQTELTWYPQLRNYTLDIACKLLIGLDQGSETTLGELFETWCAGLFSIPVNLPWTAFGKAWRSREKLLAEIEQLVRSRQTLIKENPDRPETDALDIMLNARDEETGEGLSIEELKDQVLLLLFAGHETLTSAIASFCLLTAQNPDVLAKARTEQAQFANQPLTLELLKQMTYLDQVIKEVMRLVPPVGGGFRKVLRDCEYGGFTLPKGWSALYQIGSTHSDRDIFPNPKDFNPERFSPDAEKLKPFSHVPFGGGLRECLGKEFARLEMKVFAARLLREYSWTLLPNQDLSMRTVPTPKPRDGLKVRFAKR